jgi:hypothetical protein
MQKLLRPSHYGAIDVWMRNHNSKEKKGMVLLAEAAVGNNGWPVQQDKHYEALSDPVHLNPKGRHKNSNTVHVTADRQQHDLLKLTCKADQTNMDLERKRRFLRDFAAVPNTDSVSEFYRLSDVPISAEPGAKVLHEDARRGLTRWQIRGPERNREDTATICQALRSLGSAVDQCPTYADELRIRKSGSQGAKDCLHSYGETKRASRQGTYLRRLPTTQPGQGLSRSMPSIPQTYLSMEDLKNVERPGGYRVELMDIEPLAMRKNRMRGITSKMAQGGSTSWATSNGAMSEWLSSKKQVS